MNREELLRLRAEIIASARQLAIDGVGEPSDKLEVLMSLIRSGDTSQELLSRAYQTAQQLSQDSDKLSAFLDIVYEIDAELASNEEETTESTPHE